MAYQIIDGVRVWGNPDPSAVSQAKTCAEHGNVVQALLMADHHKGYSQPIGGVVVYDGQISPSGVGYDIACGNKAVRTNLLRRSAGRGFLASAPGEKMDQLPVLLDSDSELGDMYYRAMKLAGRYAYAGRDYVIEQVLSILGAKADFEVHNHHNYAWRETHFGKETIVVRKGATPSAPGQLGFIGGSMGDISVIVRGKDTPENRESYYSTVLGVGRIMSRTQAAGKMNWKTRTRIGGQITPEQMMQAVRAFGVELRGAGTDESPFVYRKLQEVLDAHAETIEVLHVLKPIGVCMAGAGEFDPYKD